jgi:membrane-bound lytic murein transglycosylase B
MHNRSEPRFRKIFLDNSRRRRFQSAAAAIGVLVCTITFESLSAVGARAQSVDENVLVRFLNDLWPIAQKAGVSRVVFDDALVGLTPDLSVTAKLGAQPEFNRPIQSYITGAVSAERTGRGILTAKKWRRELDRIESRFGVPREIVLAVMGMETDFVAPKSDLSVIRSLATLAALGRPSSPFTDELVAALVMMQSGIPKAALKGSWAGAMGYPQFLPSAYLKYAVPLEGSTNKADIWSSIPDSLASIAHFLQMSGWTPDLPWGFEVIVPYQFDYRLLHSDFADFAKLGFRAADGSTLRHDGRATLYFPAGATGPALLLSDNYWTIKQYNNSDAYALSVALLANRIAGKPAMQRAWPSPGRLLDRQERVRLQEYLTNLGYYGGVIDGKIGPATRDSVHMFQLTAGIVPADGFPSDALFNRLEKAALGH